VFQQASPQDQSVIIVREVVGDMTVTHDELQAMLRVALALPEYESDDVDLEITPELGRRLLAIVRA
jgi:HSP20 family molecular chaperone IbpA